MDSAERAYRQAQIEEIVNRETRAWDTQDAELLLSVFHTDMVWPWPPAREAHDPISWIFPMGRYHPERWRQRFQQVFDRHDLIHNRRVIQRIELSAEGDGAFAVVDIDTLWRSKEGQDFHWLGRACKGYTKVGEVWKMIFQTGLLDYRILPE